MSKSLARRPPSEIDQLREQALAEVIGDVADDDAKVCRAMNLARYLRRNPDLLKLADGGMLSDDEWKAELARRGLPDWITPDDLTVAVDSLHSSKEAPVYLKYANERHQLRYRGNEGTGPAPVAVGFIIPVPIAPTEEQQKRARVVDVDEVT